MTKSPIIVDLKFSDTEVAEGLKGAFPEREIINLADPANKMRDLTGIDYALVWKSREDLFARAPDLKAIFSGGAGVDHVLTLPGLPKDIPLIRFVDNSLTTRMSEWVVMQCLMHLRQVIAYGSQRSKKLWKELPQPEAKEVTVGVMGLGVLGQDAAFKLQIMGFEVIGWSRTAKDLKGMETFDAEKLDAFLARTDILVGLLPLTDDTRGIFDVDLFKKLRRGGALEKPMFINAGRGGSQVEADILGALDDGILGGASLDVFEIEPLPQESPFWVHPHVFMTPHAAAASDVRALFRHVEKQIARHEQGLPLEHVVNRETGY